MKKTFFLCFVIITVLAAGGCRHAEQLPSSPAESTEQGSAGFPELDTELDTTRNTEPENEKESSSESTAADIPPETTEEAIELEYVLDATQECYFIHLSGKVGFQEEDGYYTLTGDKVYAGPIVLTWKEKALVDAGAVLKIMYQGEELNRLKAVARQFSLIGQDPVVEYRGNHLLLYAELINLASEQFSNGARRTMEFVDISEAPYNGIAFFLMEDQAKPHWMPMVNLILEEDITLKIPGDTVIEPYEYIRKVAEVAESDSWTVREEILSHTWTVKEFFDVAVDKDPKTGAEIIPSWGKLYEVIEEDGVIVKIIEMISL